MCKLDLILCYFGIRKFSTHWVSLGFFNTLVPLSIFTPEVLAPLQAGRQAYHQHVHEQCGNMCIGSCVRALRKHMRACACECACISTH